MPEVCLWQLLHTTSGDLPQQKGVVYALCTAVFTEVNHLSTSDHMFDFPLDHNHVYWLIEYLASCYVKIRMHHLTRSFNEKVSGRAIHKKLSKLVLFSHQWWERSLRTQSLWVQVTVGPVTLLHHRAGRLIPLKQFSVWNKTFVVFKFGKRQLDISLHVCVNSCYYKYAKWAGAWNGI